MAHSHEHHAHDLSHISSAFLIGIFLNMAFVIIQLTAGIYIHSLSLLSDAGHNFADVASLALSFLAIKLNKVKATKTFTYGYRKTSIIIALVNSIILLFSIGIISYEAVHRLFHPTVLPGKVIAWVALGGLFVNGISALFFLRDKDKDLNIKSAFLHLAADAMISLGVVAGGIIIYYTHLYWIDAVLSIIIALVILIGTWRLLTASMRLSLDAVPDDIHIENIKKTALQIPGIINIHHLHIWAISTTENALTGHLVLSDDISVDREQEIKASLRRALTLQNVHHITLETEREAYNCERKEC